MVIVVAVEVSHAWVFALDLMIWLRWSCYGSAFERIVDGDDRLEAFVLLWDFPDVSRDQGEHTALIGLKSGLILYKDPVFNNRPFLRAFCRACEAEARNFGLHG